MGKVIRPKNNINTKRLCRTGHVKKLVIHIKVRHIIDRRHLWYSLANFLILFFSSHFQLCIMSRIFTDPTEKTKDTTYSLFCNIFPSFRVN